MIQSIVLMVLTVKCEKKATNNHQNTYVKLQLKFHS